MKNVFLKTIKQGVLALVLGICLLFGGEITIYAAELEEANVQESITPMEAISGTWGDLTWEYTNATLTIRGTGEMEDRLVGEEYPWEAYAAIITKVVVEDGITRTSYCAFMEMENLTSVSLGNTVQVIGEGSFAYCESLKEIALPDSVTGIEVAAFYSSGLGEIVFSDNLTTIGEQAFFLTGLREIVLPDSVEVIEYAAFAWSCLESVTLGENVKGVGEAAFWGCPYLTSFTNYSNNTVYFQELPGTPVLGEDSGINVEGGFETVKVYAVPGSTTQEYVEWYKGISDYELVLEFVPILDAPENVAVSNISTGVNLSWNAVTGATSYEVYRSATKDGTYSLVKSGVTATQYVDTAVKGGSTYYYKIVACYENAKSERSEAKAITYVAVPTFKKIVNVVSGVHVYWNAASGATSYNVYRSTTKASGYSIIKSGLSATHYIDTTAVSGTTYYYKIVAVKDSAKSAFSAPFNGITYVGTPDITSRFNKGAGVQLGWNKIAGATGYAIYRKPYDGNTWTRVTTIEGNKTFTWMDESVKANNGIVYKYTIRALAGSDMKTLSGCRSMGRTMARLTSRTLNSATKASATSIKCNWSTTSVCNGYEVRFMAGDTVYQTFTVGNYKTGVKTFTGLKAGQTYKIQVRSYKKVDGVGTFYSAWSTAKTVSL